MVGLVDECETLEPEERRRRTWYKRRQRRRKIIGGAVAAVVLLAVGYGGVQSSRAAQAGERGKNALLAAERHLRATDVPAARRELARAASAFEDMQGRIDALGPIAMVGRQVPMVRAQLQGVEAFARSGEDLAAAGLALADAASSITDPVNEDVPLSAVVDELREVHTSLAEAELVVEAATLRVADLDGKRLLGPLEGARQQLAERLPEALDRTRAATDGLDAFLLFAGESGPRRYLLLSQNPDEVRPTGGFIGTYGVMTTVDGELELEGYASIESWYLPRPEAVVPAALAPSPFSFGDIPQDQTIANVNAVADWPTAATVARELWVAGGEAPVDGVIGFTPEYLVRLLRVIGPVEVPDFGETVTADRFIERVDFYTHGDAADSVPDADRKTFIAASAEVILDKLLDVPASQWQALAEASAEAADRRELVTWSADEAVQRALIARRWDGTLPKVTGDFFHQAEFAFAAKNGRGLHRTFEHVVQPRPDGSGRVTTTVTIENTRPYQPRGSVNIDSLSYITVYGPRGAQLAEGADPPTATEPTAYGHPAVAYDRAAKPLDSTQFTVAWEVPELLVLSDDGGWAYRLAWLPVPANSADELRLRVELPAGMRWADEAPPGRVRLDRYFHDTWDISTG